MRDSPKGLLLRSGYFNLIIASLSELCTSALCVLPDKDLCVSPGIELCVSPGLVFFMGLELVPDLFLEEVRVAASLPVARLPKILIGRLGKI